MVGSVIISFSTIFFILLISSSYCHAIPIITLPTGELRGVSGPGYTAYLGIPYALPPVGSLRWAPPVANPNWNIGNATTYKPCCPQAGNFYYPNVLDEDCLFLNIWVPDPLPSNAAVPVFFFIHGGGFTQGSGSFPLYWGDFIANTTQQIAVTFNYRLGALGYLSSPLLPGNWGLMDQVLALRWVHDNIAAFGGDPQNVTISGQSAGGMSVAIHMVTLQGTNLFQRARIESNPQTIIYRTPNESATYANALAGFMSCPSSSLTCLRAAPWQSVLAAQQQLVVVPFPLSGRDALPWAPAIDGSYLIDQPLKYFAVGNFTYVPTIINTVANETLSFIYAAFSSPLSPLAYEILLGGLFPSNFSALFHLYFPDSNDARPALARLTSDAYMICSSRAIARSMASFGAPVALTAFMYDPPLDPINPLPECENLAACHGAELAFVFHSKGFFGLSWTSSSEEMLSWRLLNYWTAASYNGVALPAYESSSDLTFAFNLTDSAMSGYHSVACDLWDSILNL